MQNDPLGGGPPQQPPPSPSSSSGPGSPGWVPRAKKPAAKPAPGKEPDQPELKIGKRSPQGTTHLTEEGSATSNPKLERVIKEAESGHAVASTTQVPPQGDVLAQPPSRPAPKRAPPPIPKGRLAPKNPGDQTLPNPLQFTPSATSLNPSISISIDSEDEGPPAPPSRNPSAPPVLSNELRPPPPPPRTDLSPTKQLFVPLHDIPGPLPDTGLVKKDDKPKGPIPVKDTHVLNMEIRKVEAYKALLQGLENESVFPSEAEMVNVSQNLDKIAKFLRGRIGDDLFQQLVKISATYVKSAKMHIQFQKEKEGLSPPLIRGFLIQEPRELRELRANIKGRDILEELSNISQKIDAIAKSQTPQQDVEKLLKFILLGKSEGKMTNIAKDGGQVPIDDVARLILQKYPNHLTPTARYYSDRILYGVAFPIKAELNNKLIPLAKNPLAQQTLAQLHNLKDAILMNIPYIQEGDKILGSPFEIFDEIIKDPNMLAIVKKDPVLAEFLENQKSQILLLRYKRVFEQVVKVNVDDPKGNIIRDKKFSLRDPSSNELRELTYKEFLESCINLASNWPAEKADQLDVIENLLRKMYYTRPNAPPPEMAVIIHDKNLWDLTEAVYKRIHDVRADKVKGQLPSQIQVVQNQFRDCASKWKNNKDLLESIFIHELPPPVPLREGSPEDKAADLKEKIKVRYAQLAASLGLSGKYVDKVQELYNLEDPARGIKEFSRVAQESVDQANKMNTGIEDQAYAMSLVYLGALGLIKQNVNMNTMARDEATELEWEIMGNLTRYETSKLADKPYSFMYNMPWIGINAKMERLLRAYRDAGG